MKSGISVILAGAIALSLLAACSKDEGPSQAAEDSNPPIKGKQTFTMLTESHPSWPYDKNAWVWKMIEEKTDVILDVAVPSGKLEDTINLNVASVTMPDITYMLTRSMANKYGQQGALANILDYMEEMPNFKEWMEKHPDAAKAGIAADGNMYMLPNEGIGETNRMIWLYRADVFQKHHLHVPKTYDELYNVLKKLKELYPESYPFTFRFGMNLGIMRNLTPQFATNDWFYQDEQTQEVRYGPIEEGYKNLIGFLNKLYAERLMPPDWLTIETKQWQDMIATNSSFITVDYIGRIDFFNSAMRGDNSEFNMAFMSPPAGEAGQQKNAYTHYQEAGMTVAANSINIKEVMQFMDWFYTDEARTLMSWGKEGETYTVENGKKKIKSDFLDVADLRKKTNLATNGAYTWFDYDAHLSMASKELQDAYVEARKYDAPFQVQPVFNEKELELMSTTGLAIEKNRNETITKFILGQIPMEEWDKYVDTVKKLGLQQIIDIHKAAFDRTTKVDLK